MAKTKDAGRSIDWARLSGALSATLTAFLLLGLVAGLSFGLRPLEARAAEVLGTHPATITISWPTYRTADGGQATWLAEQFQDEILSRAAGALNPSAGPTDVFRPDALRAVGEALRSSGWFDGVPAVTRRADGEIHVEGQWRTPAAVVRSGDKDCLVSWTGMPMPVEYAPGTARGQTVILNVAAPAPADDMGLRSFLSPWPGDDVQASLELLKLVAVQAWRDQVVAIDAGPYTQTRQLALITKRGGRVVWGGRPSAPLHGEASTGSKIAKLDRLNREFRSIDAGRAAIEIFWESQPLEIDVSATGSAP